MDRQVSFGTIINPNIWLLVPIWKIARKNSKIITRYKYHRWMLQSNAKWILISRGWWITVHNCARRKRTSIVRASNLPSLLWSITSKVQNIRTTLKHRSNVYVCIGEPLPPQKLWTEHPHTSHFLVFSLHSWQCRTWHWLKECCARHSIPSMPHAHCVFAWYHSALFTVSLIFYLILLIFHFILIFHVGRFGEKYTVHSREWGAWHFCR